MKQACKKCEPESVMRKAALFVLFLLVFFTNRTSKACF